MVAVDGGEHSQTATGSPACPGRQIGVTVTAANTVEQIIGERLRLRRTAFGLTQEQLGQAVGLSYQQIQKYENGSNQITVTRLLQLSDRLAVPVAYFLAGLPGTDATAGSTPAETEFASALGRIGNIAVRRAVTGLVRTVADRQG